MNNKVLFVDDEKNVLMAYTRTLRSEFEVSTALSGPEGLEIAENKGPFAVIVSDMQMPEMNGAEFLSKAKEKFPDTIRVMLTGNADQQTAIDAVNKGDIYKFLNKPCPPKSMTNVLGDAIKQHNLLTAEKDLLENTLKGSINALSEVLAMINPIVFGRISRYKELMRRYIEQAKIKDSWQLETTTMLCLIGTITLPDDMVKEAYNKSTPIERQNELFLSHPGTGANIVANIPRLEEVSRAIRYQHKFYNGEGYPKDDLKAKEIPLGGRLLNLIISLDNLETAGFSFTEALKRLKRMDKFDPELISVLAKTREGDDEEEKLISIDNLQLQEGMILGADIKITDGRLLVCKGQKLSESVIERIQNFHKINLIKDEILIYDQIN